MSTLRETLRKLEHEWRVRAMKLLDKMTTASERMQQQTLVKCADELAAALAAEGPRQRVVDAIVKGNVETLLAMQAAAPSLHKEGCKCKPVMVDAGDSTWWDTDTTQCPIHGATLHKEGAGGGPAGRELEFTALIHKMRNDLWPRQAIALVDHYAEKFAALAATDAPKETGKLWRISQAVQLHSQNDLAGLQQFYDYVKGVVEGAAPKTAKENNHVD